MLSRKATPAAHEGTFRRTVHVSDAKRSELLGRLSEIARAAELFDYEEDEHAEQRSITMRVTVHHPGGGSARFLVLTHNFCPQGMWFLHSGFLNPKTQCVFILPRGDDQEGGVLGTVEQCHLIERNVHAVGVRFDTEIDAESIMNSQPGAAMASASSLELPRLDASVLVLDDQRADCELLAFHLRSTGLRLVSHRTLADAVNEVADCPPTLVICELNLSDCRGEDALLVLRKAGAIGPAIVLTSETDPKRLRAAKQAGAYAIVPKPYETEKLIRTIVAALATSAQAAPEPPAPEPRRDTTPIVSTKASDDAMRPLIEGFVEQVRIMVDSLVDAVREGDGARVRRVCLSLKGSGSGYGFEGLSTAAAAAVKQLDTSPSLDAAVPVLKELISLAPRLSAEPAGDSVGAEAA